MSKVAKLICLALVVTPFFIIPDMGIREAKMACAGFFSLSIISLALYQGLHIRIDNEWLLIFIPYLILSIYLAPSIPVKFLGTKISSPWLFKPLLYIIIFFLLYIVVRNYKFNDSDVSGIFSAISWIGTLMGLYVIAQNFGIDRFFIPRPMPENVSGLTQPNLVGSFGNPTLVSPFISMCIPFALAKRKYVRACIMALSVVMTLSAVAIAAMITSVLFYFLCNRTSIAVSLVSSISALIIIVALTHAFGYGKSLLSDSGRKAQWISIVGELRKPFFVNKLPYGLTGFGLGSMPYLYAIPNKSDYFQAHNEFVDVAYQTGFAGLILFLLALCSELRGTLKKSPELFALLSSFLCIMICACGTFVWQIGAIAFQTIIVIGLLNSRKS